MPDVSLGKSADHDDRAEAPELDLERYAEVVALLAHFRHVSRSEVLERLAVGSALFERSREHWMAAIAAELDRDVDVLARCYGEAFARKTDEVATTKPMLDALGQRSLVPLAHAADVSGGDAVVAEVHESRRPEPSVPQVADSSGVAMPRPQASSQLHLPSYLLAPPPVASPDETVLGATPPTRVLPFSGQVIAPPPAPPVEPSPDAGGTVLAPLATELRDRAKAIAGFDPDVTLPPVSEESAALPFAGATSPERLRAITGPPNLDPATNAGETVMLPVPEDVRTRVMALLQPSPRDDLSLTDYAVMRAELLLSGEDDEGVLSKFGLTKVTKERIQQRYFARFREDPVLRDRFEALLLAELRKLHRGGGDQP